MDSYQRSKVDMSLMYCTGCEETVLSKELPLEMLQAVQEGNVDMVRDYINMDGDVNALHELEGLLSRACAEGQAEIVKLLLQYRNVHLNIAIRCGYLVTPLMRAVQNGHLECVELLIDAPVACNLQLHNCWKSIVKCLETQTQLLPRSAAYILREASIEGQWDAILLILKSDHHFVKEDLYPLVLMAVQRNRWDVIYIVFNRDFHGKLELISEVLAIAVNMRSWARVEEVLPLIESDLKFEIDFVEAGLDGRLPEAQRLLAESQYDSETLNGNLLVVAAGGTYGPIAELLMTVKNVYTNRTYSCALFLAAIRNCVELFPKLLHNREASYSIKDLHQAKEELKRSEEEILLMYFDNYLKTFCEIN